MSNTGLISNTVVHRILYVEDDRVDQMAFKRLVRDQELNYDYVIAGSIAEAKEVLANQQFDVVLTDYFLGDGTAFDIIDLVKETPIIFATGTGDEKVAVEAMRRGARDYLIKDPDRSYLTVLPLTVDKVIEERNRDRELRMLSQAIKSIHDSVFITDLSNKFIFVNRAFCETYGYDEPSILGANTSLLWVDGNDSELLNDRNRVAEGEYYHKRSDGASFPVLLSWSFIEDQEGQQFAIVGVSRDITERKQAEIALQSSEERYRAIVEDQTEMICRLTTNGTLSFVNEAYCDYFHQHREMLLGTQFGPHLPHSDAETPGDALKHYGPDNLQATYETHQSKMDGSTQWQQWKIRALLDDHGAVAEYQAVGRDITERKLAEIALSETGSRIQQTLLLGQPPTDLIGVEIASLTVPSLDVDGDFYDFHRWDAYAFDVVLGDVMGKGVPAALTGAATKSQFPKAMTTILAASEPGTIPRTDSIVQSVHDQLSERLISLETFVTVCYARFDLLKRSLTYVDCGHMSTVVYRADSKSCITIQGDNLAFGFVPYEEYHQFSTPLAEDDVFVFYSDGVTEAANIDDELFGLDRLLEFVTEQGGCSAEQISQALYDRIKEWTGTDKSTDDLTCVVVKIGPPPSELLQLSRELMVTSTMDCLPAVREFIQEFVEHDANCRSQVDNVELVMNEAVTNVIRHAYQGVEGQPLKLVARLYPTFMELLVLHKGSDFNPSSVKPPCFDGSRDGGFGLYIIEELMDYVDHASIYDGWRSTRMLKRR